MGKGGVVRRLIGELIFKTDADKKLKRVDASLNNVTKAVRKMSNRWRKLRYSMRRAGAEMQSLIGAYVGFRSMQYAVVGVTDKISDLTTEAEKLGLSARSLQLWRYAFEAELGKPANEAGMMINKIGATLGGVFVSKSPMVISALRRLGISLRMLKQLSPDDQFKLVAMRLGEVKDRTDQIGIATAFAEKEGAADFVLLANNIDRVIAAQKRMSGLALTDKEAKAQARMTRQLAAVKLGWMKVELAIVEAVNNALGPLLSKVSAWLKDSKNVATLKEWATRIFKIGSALASALLVIKAFSIAKVIMFGFADSLVKLFGILKAITVFLVANPYVALAAAIIGIGIAIYVYRDKIMKFLKSAWQAIVRTTKKVWRLFKTWGPTIGLLIAGPLGYAVAKIVILIVKHFDKIVAAVKVIIRWFLRMAKVIGSAFKAVAEAIGGVFKAIGDAIVGSIKWVMDKVTGSIRWVLDKLHWILKKAPSWMVPSGMVGDIETMQRALSPTTGRKAGPGFVQSTVGQVVVNVKGSTNMRPVEMKKAVANGVKDGLSIQRARVAHAY